MNDEDQDLVQRCLAGSESAYCEFVERFQGLVYGVCLRMLGNRHDAEDAAQEVLVRALRGLKRFDEERPLRPWVLTITANRCRTFLSQRQRRPVAAECPMELADHRPNEDGARELQAEIQNALTALREDYRQVFLLFHEQGLSYQEMSETTGKPVGTLKTWLHRARAQMLEFLKAKGMTPENHHDLSGV